jgi:DNA-binding response OmpR family regulator
MPSRILIVDDEPNILGTVTPLLRSRGYEVSSAMTGERVWMPSNATSRI